jgi:hypothetical protein
MDLSTRPPSRSSLSAFFDLSFRRFATPRLLGLVYVVIVIAAALAAWVPLSQGFASIRYGIGTPILFIIPLVQFIVTCVAARLCLEAVAAVFRILDHLEAPPPA